ncbi:hypothetical protein [Microbulbifer sp. ALW1]|uniref:hypothetical protein n=1 Tax=Microbulbifer sp. (strain ALW1) TaxID=1516059 RepID=UPI00135A0FD4|nr:hypothetical protein [Microbulbifer sp. ALW1]
MDRGRRFTPLLLGLAWPALVPSALSEAVSSTASAQIVLAMPLRAEIRPSETRGLNLICVGHLPAPDYQIVLATDSLQVQRILGKASGASCLHIPGKNAVNSLVVEAL